MQALRPLRRAFLRFWTMPSVYDLKPRFQNLLRPMVRKWHACGITANQVTAGAALGSVALGAGLAWAAHEGAHGWFALLPLWMLARMALNAVDGMLAREFGQQSTLGAYLNELCDVVADAALYLPFALLPGAWAWAVALVVFAAMLTEYAGVLGCMAGKGRCYEGPMGKSDRAVVFGVLGLAAAVQYLSPAWQNGIMLGVAALLVLTIANRVRAGVNINTGTGAGT